jgi:hypothetical protein
VVEKVSQSNSSLNALVTLVTNSEFVKMPAGGGAVKTTGRSLSLSAHLKK